ncbi:homoserine kinase [Paenibacillus polymyxa]|uniref:phosphotransferase n=1 Tax=Paenibacillus polymyxa TaxID=1406 RepID=UPI0008FC2B02|nr:phosphotransferase [Paenibacillus polymyxa]APB72466.1 homoserine kinase [Paenibacillus polymyxa]
METFSTNEIIQADLMEAFHRFFGLNIIESVPIQRGWLNLKWKITTNNGTFLLKQYNKQRYKDYNFDDLLRAFSQQERLHGLGLACPRLFNHEGQVFMESERRERFLVMEFCPGTLVSPGEANVYQLYELGKATGKMHHWLNDGTIRSKSTPKLVLSSRKERLAHWDSVWKQAEEADKKELLADIETQRKATEMIPIEIMDAPPPGWAHRDLWADNVLFNDDKLSAILDFDRLDYDYPQLDIARAVMSFAWDKQLKLPLVSAFMAGYREEHTLVEGCLTRSLQWLWYMESVWWIKANMDEHSVPIRFAKEMNWFARNYKVLPDLLADM